MDVEMDNSTKVKVSFSPLLELAADNDLEGFKEYVELNPDAVDEVGLWYGRQAGSKGMVLEYRTPLMVAALFGSLDVMKVILSLSEVDVNVSCGADKTSALHCAAFGGYVDAVKLLLVEGASVNLVDGKGNKPYDVINESRNQPELRVVLRELLSCDNSKDEKDQVKVLVSGLKVTPLDIPSLSEDKSPDSEIFSSETNATIVSEKKEYPVDPSLPDIKNSIYSTDEFRMYSFKIRPCSRAYSHDWTECPFAHPGENARRRDPRKYHYSCVPCPEFRKGSCIRGDMCEYGHGVFECWLHPAQYRTRLCKDGTTCNRRVCFFAHTPDELRPLYTSTGSAVPSSRSMASAAAVMDMAAALNMFPGGGGSPRNPFSPPMSPSGNGAHSSSSGWQQQNIPALHLQASNLQASRLRLSLNARDIQAEELCMLRDLELAYLSQPQFDSPSARSNANLDELFSAEMSLPRYSDPIGGSSHKMNHFQMQQSMLSPINTKSFSPKSVGDHPMMHSPFGASSPRMMSPRGMDPQSPLNARLVALSMREKHHHQMRSLSARDLSANLPHDLISENVGSHAGSSWSKWESSNGLPDWSINGDELNRLKRSNSMGPNGEEPDLSWVQSLVKDQPFEKNESHNDSFNDSNPR